MFMIKFFSLVLKSKILSKNNNFILIKQLINADEIKEIIQEFKKNKTFHIDYKSDYRLFYKNATSLSNEIMLPKVKNIFSEYIPFYYFYHHNWMINHIYSSENFGSGGGWHRDTSNLPQYKLITYLSDCESIESGPFEILNTECVDFFKLGINPAKLRYSNEEVEKLKIHGAKSIIIYGRAGDSFLVNTQNIHRGMPAKNAGRLAITSYSYLIKTPGHLKKLFLNSK